MERRKPYWDKLETLVNACARRGVGALGRAELRELALLYRQTAADLSVARVDPAGTPLARYLNTLFAAGLLAGALLAWADPGFERLLLGGKMIDTIERGQMWTQSIVSVKPLAS